LPLVLGDCEIISPIFSKHSEIHYVLDGYFIYMARIVLRLPVGDVNTHGKNAKSTSATGKQQ